MKSFWGITLFVLGFVIGAYIFHSKAPEVITEVRVDTVTVNNPVPVEQKIVETKIKEVPLAVHDTIISQSIRTVTLHDTIFIVIDRIQQHYSQPGSYDAWISGVDPQLDSIKVYNKTITNTIVPKKRHTLGLYVQAGYLHINNGIGLGAAGLEWEMPCGLSIHGGYGGLIHNRELFHGPEVGLKYKFNFLK